MSEQETSFERMVAAQKKENMDQFSRPEQTMIHTLSALLRLKELMGRGTKEEQDKDEMERLLTGAINQLDAGIVFPGEGNRSEAFEKARGSGQPEDVAKRLGCFYPKK